VAHIAGPIQPEVVAPEWMFCCAVRIAVTAPAQQAAGPTVIMLAVQHGPLRNGRLLDPVATAAADCLRPPCLSPGLTWASVGGRVRRAGSVWSDSRVASSRASFAGGIVGFSKARFEGGLIDFADAGDWSHPPSFDSEGELPSTVRLPAKSHTSPAPHRRAQCESDPGSK